MPRLKNLNPNLAAFLDMISISEGTHGKGDGGYNVIVGGTFFKGYEDHPRILIDLPKLGLKSSAAGRYQLLAKFYDAYKKLLHLKDFSPESQDKIAIQQIKERHALELIEKGSFVAAINQVKNIWASLPRAGYGQHENSIDNLEDVYLKAGGKIT